MNLFNKSDCITKIIRFNHAWKIAKEKYGEGSGLATMLRDQKSCLQASLLRYSGDAYLVEDNDAMGEKLYSVRFDGSVSVGTMSRTDAEHIPVRVAEKLLTENELLSLIRD